MYYQCKVDSIDRDVSRLLWFENDNVKGNIITLRMTEHPFGSVWSPSCANYALKKTATGNIGKALLSSIGAINKLFYVDDCP